MELHAHPSCHDLNNSLTVVGTVATESQRSRKIYVFHINHAYKSLGVYQILDQIFIQPQCVLNDRNQRVPYRYTILSSTSPAPRKIRYTRILSTHVQIGYTPPQLRSFCLGRPILSGFLSHFPCPSPAASQPHLFLLCQPRQTAREPLDRPRGVPPTHVRAVCIYTYLPLAWLDQIDSIGKLLLFAPTADRSRRFTPAQNVCCDFGMEANTNKM